MHSAFHPLFHHCAGRFVRLVHVAVEIVIVRAAPARTDKFRKTVFAFFTGEQAGIFELFPNVGTGNPFVHVAHFELLVPCELVARIQIAVGRYREIFVTRSARGNALGKTRTAFQIDIEMEEIEPFPFGVAL